MAWFALAVRPVVLRRVAALACAGALAASVSCRRPPKPTEVNLIFVLVDTMRADALGRRDGRTPFLDGLARDGTVFERAYAQASWTLPSISSLLAGRWPAESPGWSEGTQGIPPGVVSLAELLHGAGMRSAAFVSNPLLKESSGFGRGFESYWASRVEDGVLTPAAVAVDQAIPWISAHRKERFFVLLHLMDPHDPYCPPARRVGPPGAWPGNPDPAFTGAAPMPDAATVASWKGLYAEEVSYLDSQLARLFASLDPDVRARTAVVLTADHGEEFLDHGFLKHAVTLFDEAVHVPLIVRMPGAPAGRRVAAVVRLVDVVPTVADLLAVPVAEPVRARWAGVSLAPAVRGTAPVPPLLAMGETFGFGPLRWYVFDGRRKVVLFNKDHRIPNELPALKNPNEWLTKNLPAEGVYVSTAAAPTDVRITDGVEEDLRQAHNLASRYVSGKIGGLWLAVRGPGRGGSTDVSFALPGIETAHVIPFFWRAGDVVRPEKGALELHVADDGITRVAVVLGVDEASARVLEVLPKDGAASAHLRRPGPDEKGAFAWYEKESRTLPSAAAGRTEMLFRLRALGYIN